MILFSIDQSLEPEIQVILSDNLVVAFSPLKTIGSNFMLCKKPLAVDEGGNGKPTMVRITKKNLGSWKPWFNKSHSFKISSH
uniref:Uncharacterized protein n=1 Tax=Lactuca sativa TaxID=4236 RepID=A0A9R1WH38_LACSA|nr:hypothetical protein LSAT_V11C200085880 [Lactuca sativa]